MDNRKILIGFLLTKDQMQKAIEKNTNSLVINIEYDGGQYKFSHNNKDEETIIAKTPFENENLFNILDIEKYDSWGIINEENITSENLNHAYKAIYEIGSIFNHKIMIRNTIISDTTLNYLQNSLSNLPLLKKENNLEALKQYNFNMPALIVAAGPSLNKQIEILKKNQEKFLIICVNQIYKLLIENDINPNIVICLDSGAMPNWEIKSSSNKPIFFIDVGCRKEIIINSGQNIFFTTTNIDIANILSNFSINVELLETGGSVATSAYSLAKVLGSNPIIFIGQDLALTNNKDHADGYKDTYSEEMLTQRKELGFEVQGYYGGYVKTERQLNFYLKWFESEFAKNNERIIFNCTEGGANIKGAINLPFADVIEELKKFEYKIPQTINTIIDQGSINKDVDYSRKIRLHILEIDKIITKIDSTKSFKNEDNFNMQAIIGKSGNLTKIIIAYFCQKQLYEFNNRVSRATERTEEELNNFNRDLAASLRIGLVKSKDFLTKILSSYQN
jgi:hypothetical protein